MRSPDRREWVTWHVRSMKIAWGGEGVDMSHAASGVIKVTTDASGEPTQVQFVDRSEGTFEFEDFVEINGAVRIGANVFVGSHATLVPDITIGDGAYVDNLRVVCRAGGVLTDYVRVEVFLDVAREALFDCYAWESGEVEFTPGLPSFGRAVGLKLPLATLHRDAVSRRSWSSRRRCRRRGSRRCDWRLRRGPSPA